MSARSTEGVLEQRRNYAPLAPSGQSSESGTATENKNTPGNVKEGFVAKRLAEIEFESGSYVAVLVAAFGGVQIELSAQRHAKVHPLFMLLCALPLFSAQLSALFALRTDIELSDIYIEGDVASEQLMRLKLVVVVIVFLINFRQLLNSAQLLLLTLNPITWLELRHPTIEEWQFPAKFGSYFRWCFCPCMLVPWPLIALFMHFAISYVVCTDSVSVILDCTSAKETMFNSVAITFITELSKYWWQFCAQVLHLSQLEDFVFELVPPEDVWTEDGDLTPRSAGMIMMPSAVRCLARATHFRCLGTGRTVLSRGAGARRLENLVALGLMYLIYKRQLYVVLLAMDTNVLPAARDICMQWRLEAGENAFARLIEQIMVIDAPAQLQMVVERQFHGSCSDPKFDRMSPEDEAGLRHRHKIVTFMFSAVVGCVLMLPHLAHSLHHLFLPSYKESAEDAAGQQAGDVEVLRTTCKQLKEKMEQQQRQIQVILKRQSGTC